MPCVVDHLSISDLEQRFRSCPDPVEARHVQVIWLLAQGHTVKATSKVTAFGTRWIQQLVERYNASGPDALANGRRRNGLKPSLLTAEVLEAVRLRLAEPPPDGGLWSSRKVADVMAAHLGLGARSSPARLGGAEGARLVVAAPASQEPEVRHGRRGGGVQKKVGGCRRRGGGRPSRRPRRGVLHRRAPPRPEAGPPLGVGPEGRAPDRPSATTASSGST